jgi:hypothetical protein
VVDAAVRREELAADVSGREVVGRVGGLLPDEQRTGCVRDQLAAEVGTDPLRAVLDAHASSHLGRLCSCGAHVAGSCSIGNGAMSVSVPPAAVRKLCGGSVAGAGLAVLAAVLDEAKDAELAAELERVQ